MTSPSVSFSQCANALRALAMDTVEKAKSGHPGLPLGMADVATVLWRDYLRFDPSNPSWPDRDRFILSGGHGSALLYALAYVTGYEKITVDQLQSFRQLGSHTPGHPEYDLASAIEMTTGPLGQGLASSVGFAMGEKIMAARFGDELVNHRTFVFAGDGDMMEGISQEAISLAGHMKLGKLVVFYDDNKISIDGPTSLSFTEDVKARFEAAHWHTQSVDGHNPEEIAAALDAALAQTTQPSLIACRTIIGKGAPKKQGTSSCHGSPLGAEEIEAARQALNWPYAPFEVPEDILATWRAAGTKGQALREAWEKRLAASKSYEAFTDALQASYTRSAAETVLAFKQKLIEDKPKKASRVSSGDVLATLLPVMPEIIGGSADLTPSNNTQVKAFADITPDDWSGRYIHYGVREHGMAAAMNGLALHGGIIPYGGTFMQFTDYCRPSIRLAALMGLRTIYVMTHDSIGLGEDGPTHQPVEHLAALRAIPNLNVFRPCDGVETAEAWEVALQTKHTPSVLALSRQNLPTLRTTVGTNMTARGGYVLREAEGARAATLIATGSEVALAVEAQEKLAKLGIQVAVVSMPCFDIFATQDAATRAKVLGTAPRIGIEAALRQGWDAVLGDNGHFVGMTGFGASGPAEDLYQHFGITAEAVIALVGKILA